MMRYVLVCVYVQVLAPNLQSRYGHCAAAFSLIPGVTDVVLFGGALSFPTTSDSIIADTTVLRFVEC